MATTTHATSVQTSEIADHASAPTLSPTHRLMSIAAFVGPAILLASSLAWSAGDSFEELRGILTFWAMPALALALFGVAAGLERTAPRIRALITAITAIGAAAGAAFANEALMVEHFGVERLIDQDTPSAILALGLPGLLFPLAVMATGVMAFRHGVMPRGRAVLLAAGGLLFPVSRIPQVPALAVVADLLTFAALAPVAFAARRR